MKMIRKKVNRMKIMSEDDVYSCNLFLEEAKEDLGYCLKRMRGKFGTSDAVRMIECALKAIDNCISKDKIAIEMYQRFRNPPDRPKSRKLGWYREGVSYE
jgi:hypothetical protein